MTGDVWCLLPLTQCTCIIIVSLIPARYHQCFHYASCFTSISEVVCLLDTVQAVPYLEFIGILPLPQSCLIQYKLCLIYVFYHCHGHFEPAHNRRGCLMDQLRGTGSSLWSIRHCVKMWIPGNQTHSKTWTLTEFTTHYMYVLLRIGRVR